MKRRHYNDPSSPTKWCSKCEAFVPKSKFYKSRSRSDGLQGECKSCRKSRATDWRVTTDSKGRRTTYANKYRTSTSGRALRLLTTAKKRAQASGLPFDLTREWVQEKLDAGLCELSGLRLDLESSPVGMFNHPRAPSLDRIRHKGGYTRDNVRVVCWQANLARNEYTDSSLLELAEGIVRTISREASQEEPSTIIPKGSRAKRPEAPKVQNGL